MTTLTAKQEKFAQCVADGMTQADAYRAAYNAVNMIDNAIYREASVLLARPKIAQRVAELRANLADKALWTREKSARFYLSMLADTSGDVRASDKLTAARQLDKTHGFEKSRVDITTKGESLHGIDRAAAIRAIRDI